MDIAKQLELITSKLDAQTQEAKAQEKRSEYREKTIIEKVESLAGDVRKAQETADRAHAVALDAKHRAGQVSIDSEGTEHNLFAEMGSLKVVLNEHAEEIKRSKSEKANQAKIEAKARKFWRLASPALIALVLAILNRLTFMLAPPGPADPIIRTLPVTVITSDAGK